MENAYDLYQKVVKSGLEKANVALGYFYLQQNQTTLSEKTFEIAQKAYQTNDPESAMLLSILYHYSLAILAKQNKYTKPEKNFLSLLIRAANHYDKIK